METTPAGPADGRPDGDPRAADGTARPPDGTGPPLDDGVPQPGAAAVPGAALPDPVAIAALALGLLAVVPLVGIAAIVCGHLALHRATPAGHGRAMAGLAPGHAPEGRGLALAGLVLGYALTGLWVVLAVLLFARA